jgi:hypothetical protein
MVLGLITKEIDMSITKIIVALLLVFILNGIANAAILSGVLSAAMSISEGSQGSENYTTYTEVDPNSHLSETSSRVTLTTLRRDETAYVYKDKGAGYYNGSYQIDFLFNVASPSGAPISYLIKLANGIGSDNQVCGAGGNCNGAYIYYSGTQWLWTAAEHYGGTGYAGTSYVINASTTYYCSLVRNMAVGTYGTLYLYTYSDSDRQTLLNTQTLTLHGTTNTQFQYRYAVQTVNDGGNAYLSGYVE